MILKVPPPFRKPRPKIRPARQSSPPALTLVSAFTVGEDQLRLVFDREVDAAGLVANQITVNVPSGSGWLYVGQDLQDQPDPESIVIGLLQQGPATGTLDWMSATAGTGIVAVDDGGTWAGVTQIPLPFP